jgi:thiamine pyrophosphate-dependent acetolactate synthase large subunit-like protein
MKIKAANGVARILKTEGVPWVSCYPTNHVNNALGEEGVPILMMGEERFAVAVADGFSRVTCGKQIGVCTVMATSTRRGSRWPTVPSARRGRIPRRFSSSPRA